MRFSGLEKALSQALEAAQGPGASAEENACKLSVEEIAAIPAEFAQDTVRRIHDAAEMGDIMTLNAIAEEIKMHSDSCAPIGKQIVQLAEDFDFDGVQNLAHLLDT